MISGDTRLILFYFHSVRRFPTLGNTAYHFCVIDKFIETLKRYEKLGKQTLSLIFKDNLRETFDLLKLINVVRIFNFDKKFG